METKSIGDARNDAARRFIKRIVARDFSSNTTKAAKAFGISQSMLYEFLEGSRGAGMKLLAGVAAYASTTVDVVMNDTTANVTDAMSGLVEAIIRDERLSPTPAALLRTSYKLEGDFGGLDELTKYARGLQREWEIAQLRRRVGLAPVEPPRPIDTADHALERYKKRQIRKLDKPPPPPKKPRGKPKP